MTRTALVTGAARGIGLACAALFRREGWRVYGADLDPPGEAGIFSDFWRVDLSRDEEAAGLASSLLERESGLNCLVNNAALQVAKPLAETTSEEFFAVLATNLHTPFRLSVALLEALARSRGAIVNIASVHARATSRDIGAYAASKAGLLSLTRTMALEFAPLGVRANAVLPGAVDTDMLRRGLERDLFGPGRETDPVRELAGRHPLGRIGTPLDIARAVVFLADPEKSSFVTGQGLAVDGGCLAALSTESAAGS